MDQKENSQINPVAHKLQLMNEEIKTEMKLNPCIISKEAFIDALRNNMTKFIKDNYRD